MIEFLDATAITIYVDLKSDHNTWTNLGRFVKIDPNNRAVNRWVFRHRPAALFLKAGELLRIGSKLVEINISGR